MPESSFLFNVETFSNLSSKICVISWCLSDIDRDNFLLTGEEGSSEYPFSSVICYVQKIAYLIYKVYNFSEK